jgi:hypothetical protein
VGVTLRVGVGVNRDVGVGVTRRVGVGVFLRVGVAVELGRNVGVEVEFEYPAGIGLQLTTLSPEELEMLQVDELPDTKVMLLKVLLVQ